MIEKLSNLSSIEFALVMAGLFFLLMVFSFVFVRIISKAIFASWWEAQFEHFVNLGKKVKNTKQKEDKKCQ
jgi:hypothetical protein